MEIIKFPFELGRIYKIHEPDKRNFSILTPFFENFAHSRHLISIPSKSLKDIIGFT